MSSHETEFNTVVVSRQPAADSIDVFELARVDGSTLPSWQAGAHLDLVLPSGDERQYSLLPPASTPVPSSSTDTSTWRVAVLREPAGVDRCGSTTHSRRVARSGCEDRATTSNSHHSPARWCCCWPRESASRRSCRWSRPPRPPASATPCITADVRARHWLWSTRSARRPFTSATRERGWMSRCLSVRSTR